MGEDKPVWRGQRIRLATDRFTHTHLDDVGLSP